MTQKKVIRAQISVNEVIIMQKLQILYHLVCNH